MDNKRKEEREKVSGSFRIYDKITGQLIGTLADISTTGMMIVCEKSVETNIFQLRMDLPIEINGSKQIDFEAECTWCTKGVVPNFYCAGFRFLSFSPSDVQTIKLCIKQTTVESN